jgi:hypothetical protein
MYAPLTHARVRLIVLPISTLKAADLAIEDPPLEDILRVMFGKSRESKPVVEAS